jgi:hypothetical protein
MSKEDRELAQLKLLFDYTKFHVGLYAAVATIFGALIAADKAQLKFEPTLLFASVIFICIAGLAGGLIASSISGYDGYTNFWDAKIAPYWWPNDGSRPKYWTYIEHTAFWISVVLAILSIGVRQDSFASIFT